MKHKLALLLLVSIVLVSGCTQFTAVSPSDSGEIEIVMNDYTFSPQAIQVQAGQTITIVLRNEGAKLHEFMVGQNVRVEGNFTESFAIDFFADLDVSVEGPGMVMGLPGIDMAGMDMGDDEDMDMGDDEDMDMGDDEDMDMGDDEEEHVEVVGEFGTFQMATTEEHGGVMVMIDPIVIASDQETRITFTIPEDAVGTWEFGCFQERGQHYDDGMRGILIVEPATS
jgi:plastocyanin